MSVKKRKRTKSSPPVSVVTGAAGFLGSHLTDLLIGRIFYDGAGKIFEDMEPALQVAKQAALEY